MIETNDTTLVEMMRQLAGMLNSKLQKELRALADVMTELEVDSAAELKKAVLALKKTADAAAKNAAKAPSSADAFVERVRAFLDSKSDPNSNWQSNVDALVADFQKLTAAKIKAVGKALDLNVAAKSDAQDFETWLRFGKKPASAEEKFAQDLKQYVDEAIAIRDSSETDISEESIAKILSISEEVQKKHKIVGLIAFIQQIGLEKPIGKSATKLRDQLKTFLIEYSIDRLSMYVIRNKA